MNCHQVTMFLSIFYILLAQGGCKKFLIETLDEEEPIEDSTSYSGAEQKSRDVADPDQYTAAPPGGKGNDYWSGVMTTQRPLDKLISAALNPWMHLLPPRG
ncbi:uncharacterized protein LOC111714432 [Eurytemora carolleeae]|uniref:uncharacterized protein LOC111714432 n=1 Tax=Eurytemora carolleeae TaxID=1294199 RepID=UPI000C78B3DC|nr:uncharacterized protein LOC111714432 [Eurytemora carolleeae]|eukprot:XP_023345304.1 uncharacterized protein LOC111714432 [Eurytemora affinis]